MSIEPDDTSDAELDDRPDPALDGWIVDVAAAVDDDVVRANVPWDFAAVLARAHAIDPSFVSAQAVAEAEQAEPVISLAQRRSQRVTRDDPAFASLVQDVRAANEHDAALRMAAVGAATPRRVGSGITTGRVLTLVLALAAVVVVGFGVVRGVQVLREKADAPADAAVHQGGPSSDTPERAIVDDAAPQKTATVSPRRAPQPVAPEAIAPPTDDTLEALPAVATVRAPKKVPRPAKSAMPTEPAPREPTLTEKLAALDGEAHAAWKAGDFAVAEDKFEALIALAGTSRLADLAYGDLFTLARRRGDTKREVALWKRYLAAFESGGRFADDARAGLCRKSATDKPACWRDYLADFPEGSYRAQAEREAGSAP